MSTLRDQLAKKSAALVRRERITLPATGLEVQVRGMMMGEAVRVAQEKEERQTSLMVALVTEDPSTGEPIWNPNALPDRQAIDAMHIRDARAIMDTANRLSDIDAEGNGSSQDNAHSTLPSPSGSGEPSGS